MKDWRWAFLGLVCFGLVLGIGAVERGRGQPTERISGLNF